MEDQQQQQQQWQAMISRFPFSIDAAGLRPIRPINLHRNPISLQQQQRRVAAMISRFPSNIDAHLRPFGPINLQQQQHQPGKRPFSSLEDACETERPQLTIFYAGKVEVFDGFVPEKGTEFIELATKLASKEIDRPKRASMSIFLEKRKYRTKQHEGSSSGGHSSKHLDLDLNS